MDQKVNVAGEYEQGPYVWKPKNIDQTAERPTKKHNDFCKSYTNEKKETTEPLFYNFPKFL